ncbi:hypothetical protein F5B22DRAFT_648119 [Xylaria bambusicola]|uniref:uncharacterized protein n=1 Tax=Xylaria bambusicola TaxID=326684 RepID=UPI002007A814|nr:uncharacterized protein F5B22DRAFT_648119 [Xylaria bambusicola]KAI0513024.1 hypothetical protein F5B22DRAFT_648119 [Xylaria bambusicola]
MTRLTDEAWSQGNMIQAHPKKIQHLKNKLTFVGRLAEAYHTNPFRSMQMHLLTKIAIKPYLYPDRELYPNQAPQRPFTTDTLALLPTVIRWLEDHALEHVQFFFPPSTIYSKLLPRDWLWVLLVGDYGRYRSVCYDKPWWKFAMVEPPTEEGTDAAVVGTRWLRDPLTGERIRDASTPSKKKKGKAVASPVKVMLTPPDSKEPHQLLPDSSSSSSSDETMLDARKYPRPKRLKLGDRRRVKRLRLPTLSLLNSRFQPPQAK